MASLGYVCRGGVTMDGKIADALKVLARESYKKNVLYDLKEAANGPLVDIL